MSNKDIQTIVWEICNEIRDESSLNLSSAQPYMLGFMFYKFLSEKINLTVNKLLKETSTYETVKENKELYEKVKNKCIDKIGYFIDYKDSYKSVLEDCSSGKDILGDRLSKAFKNIQDSTIGTSSNKDFKGLFDNIHLNSHGLGENVEKITETLMFMLKSLDKPELNIGDLDGDQLGDVYEFLIGKFASESGQKAGEFYTPSQVSTLLAKIATNNITKAEYVYDPTCGSGSLLLKVRNQLTDYSRLFGQEKSTETFNLARMNMFLHGVKYDDFKIENGNTLSDNKFEEFANKIDIIVANPPFSTAWKPKEFLNDIRFNEYPKMAPEKTADFAFVQHMIYMLKPGGRLAVIVPHGILFRGNAEGAIREYLINYKKYLRAVIGLPTNMFYNASIPAAILVFEKIESEEDILFIEGSKEFIKNKNKNLMTDDNVNKIYDVYANKKEIEKFSRLVSIKEISENDFNLNITRYIDTFEEEEIIDIVQVNKDLKDLDIELSKTEKEIEDMIKELVEVK